MIQVDRFISRLLTAAMVLAIVGAGQVARAQDDEGEAEEAPAAQVRHVFMMNEAQFDQWVFGNMGGMANAGVARNRLDSLLSLHAEEVERSCRLTPDQKKKLLVAGRGDIKRFFDHIEELRRKFDKIKNDQNQIGMFWQEIQPLRTSFNAGLFGEESIFSKAIKSTLSPEQAAQREKVVRDRVLYRYWARVDLALEFLNNSVGFTTDQRQQLVRLLAEGARPPKRLGQNDYYAVLYQLAMLPEAKVKPIFDDLQWRLLSRQLAQAKGMEGWLKQNGFIPDEAPAPAAEAGAKPVANQAKAKPG